MWRHAVKPPAMHRSGCAMSTARAAKSLRKPNAVYSFSPPAIGVASARRTSRVAFQVLLHDRLLVPAQPPAHVLEAAAEADRFGDAVGVVGVDHRFVLAGGLADRAHHGEIIVDAEAELHLIGGESLAHVPLALPAQGAPLRPGH